MQKKQDLFFLLLCYVLWGFQPLYWSLLSGVDSYVILAVRIVLAAVFSVLLLALGHRLPKLRMVLRDKQIMKFLLPAVVFLLLDWAVFIVAVNSGHVLDASLGYYINPLLLFAIGVVVFKEKCTKLQLLALGVAVAGVVVSAAAFGQVPVLSLVIALNWSIYAALKKNVPVDGVTSIAIETLLLTPVAIAYLLIFQLPALGALNFREVLALAGSGIVTALPMFLYSNSVFLFPMIFMCFAQYLSPTFNLICGFLMGESFTPSQLVSLLFFLAAIVLFSIGELRAVKSQKKE